jgi:transposase InsO family protein
MNVTHSTKKVKRAVEYARRTDFSEAARRYGMCRQTISKWDKRYDGTLESLKHLSTAPRTNSRGVTDDEVDLVMWAWKKWGKHGGDWVYANLFRKKGFKRCRTTMYSILKANGITFKKQKRRRQNKPYFGALVPGQKLQMDVKYVPTECLPKGHEKLYQYTIIDEATRMRYIEIFQERSQWNTVIFVKNAIKFFGFELKEIQTDNGTEFTNKFLNTEKLAAFEKFARLKKIVHKLIRPATPRHNGRVERSHRTDQKHFYDFAKFKSFEDCKKKAEKWLKEYNNTPIRKYHWLTPRELLQLYNDTHKPLTEEFIAEFAKSQGLKQAA